MTDKSEEGVESLTIYDQIGLKGLVKIAWNSTPFCFRLLAVPYGLVTYRVLLQQSKSLDELFELHKNKYESSSKFRVLRPRYHESRKILEAYGIK